MGLPRFLEHFILASALLAAAQLGTQALRPFVDATFLGGLFFLYGLGRGRSELRWAWGPPVLRMTCWMGYAMILCRIGGVSQLTEFSLLSPTGFLLLLTLFGTTSWGVQRCFMAGRRHVTDGRSDALRDRSLSSMLRAIGLARGAALAVVAWFGVSAFRIQSGLPILGEEFAALGLFCALGISEAVTALVFGERVCPCCATPPAASAVMLARAIGLGLVCGGWTGLFVPSELVIQVGAMLYALSVLSSGSPTTLPIQFRPPVVGDERTAEVLAGHFRQHELIGQVSELSGQLQSVRRQIAKRVPVTLERVPVTLEPLSSLIALDELTVEVGRGLVSLVEPPDQKLIERVTSIRRHVAMELGIVVPGIRFRDNLQLRPQTYVIKVREVEVAQAAVQPDHFLAIGPEEKLRHLEGERTTDPTYGMPGVWITPDQRYDAERYGCMIFDPVSVIATQLTEVVRTAAPELLTITHVEQLLRNLHKPTLLAEVYPKRFNLRELRDILRALLAERVCIRDLELILETLAGTPEADVEAQVEFVRVALSRAICKEYQNNEGTINVITLDPNIEHTVQDSIQRTEQGSFLTIDPNQGQEILQAISEQVEELQNKGLQPILLTSPPIRRTLRKLTERSFPNLVLLSWNEIAPKVNVNSVAMAELAPKS